MDTLATLNFYRQKDILKSLFTPYMSEKATFVSDKHRQFVFKIPLNINKKNVKSVVEALFNVKVAKVSILTVKSKSCYFRHRLGTEKAWKKAYVTLKQGSSISFISNK